MNANEREFCFFVIPAKAGIHGELIIECMDPGFRRDDGREVERKI